VNDLGQLRKCPTGVLAFEDYYLIELVLEVMKRKTQRLLEYELVSGVIKRGRRTTVSDSGCRNEEVVYWPAAILCKTLCISDNYLPAPVNQTILTGKEERSECIDHAYLLFGKVSLVESSVERLKNSHILLMEVFLECPKDEGLFLLFLLLQESGQCQQPIT